MPTRPNFLIVMVDQLNGTLFPDGPAEFLHAPNLKALAARSAQFRNCYTASPLCAPGRASFMSGQLPSRTQVYDNAAEFASSIPTFAHHLRAAGYATCLSGKMHFVGPDQLHGFEERLTTDIYPADFGWTPDYRKPGERIDWWYHNLGSVAGAGVAEITNQMEYDDEVAFLASQKLYDFARGSDGNEPQPWCLTVSFSHPHDPYVARRKYWDLYENCQALDPEVGFIPADQQDPHSQRLYLASDYANFDITPEQVRRSRRGYFANISYLDDKVGELIDVLERTRMLDDTVILFCSDHGDMLGERGLWFKMCFFEGSARVPLMIAGKDIPAGLIKVPVSNLDICPTLCDLAGIDTGAIAEWTDGESLVPLTRGEARAAPVLMEYAAEGTYAPMVAIREGRHKFVHCEIDPPQLFDLESDPLERINLAADPANAALVASFLAKIRVHWDMAAFDAAVRASQARRWVVYPALRNGAYFPWEFQPLQKASERYMRNHMDLNVLEERKRFPERRMMSVTVPTLDHLKRAYAATSKVTQVTPLLESAALARETGAARVFVKPESLQWAGSFKVRGAYWRLKQLSPEEASRGVVAYSSGNFAQGLAAAGQALGIPVTIVMPIDAPAAKVDATADYGAKVVLTDHGDRAREEVASAKAREISQAEGLALLHPFDDPEIVAGQGGAGLEALDQLAAKGAAADMLFCPIGGGGLIGGVALAFHYLSPKTEVIGVEPEGFNGMGSSLAQGAIETMPLGPKSICDGLMARRPGDAPFAAVRAAGVRGITVADSSVRKAMKVAFERMKLVLEPSGAASLAALLVGSEDVKGKTVLVVASGGNVALADFMAHINHA